MSEQILCEAAFNYIQLPDPTEATPVSQVVRNGRQFDNPGWEISGFELVSFPSVVKDWSDEAQIAGSHYEEVASLARKMTGADHALVSSHILRNPDEQARHEDLGPIQFVHSDFAASYGDRMREFYASGTEESERSLAREQITSADVAKASRMVILQFWRNVGPQKMDLPIAFCDARTVGRNEVVALPVQDYAGGGFDFETLGVLAPEDGHHAWYSFPDMEIEEAVAFRTYDSAMASGGKAFWTPHSAYRDPAVELGEPARYSIELRATCLFE